MIEYQIVLDNIVKTLEHNVTIAACKDAISILTQLLETSPLVERAYARYIRELISDKAARIVKESDNFSESLKEAKLP